MTDTNPLQFCERLRETLHRYLSTTIGVSDDHPDLARRIRSELHAAELVKGPYLEALPDYEKGRSLAELRQAGVLHADWMAMQSSPIWKRRLHIHQETALLHAARHDNYLLAARPLRIRNFQALTISGSLRWDRTRYWLTFGTEDTKMQTAIDEPLPDNLHPYLEVFLKTWRPLLLRQARKFGGVPTHRRLWVDIFGKPMSEHTLRDLIERYTKKEFGTAVWPHLFRDCLLTSVAIDEPDLVRMSTTLLGHASLRTGEKHYNQARMIDASRRYGATISELREALLAAPEAGDASTGTE